MKNFIILLVAAIILLTGASWWSRSVQEGDSSENALISTSGIHWHPELEIYVAGEKMELPQNKGIESLPHSPVHTHEDLPLIHLEFGGTVREDDIRLGKWFEVWGKGFREFGPNVIMLVNGVENTEFEDYIMRDGDKIELRYE